jgi:hypothetical protein
LIIDALSGATDVVFSHYLGDHIPLGNANPYQLAICDLPQSFANLCGWRKSPDDLGENMKRRADDLVKLLGSRLQVSEGASDGLMRFSPSVPDGVKNSRMGTVMMTRIELKNKIFVHASDIQLLDAEAIDYIIGWQADIVLAAGPPQYLERLADNLRTTAWRNGLCLAAAVETVTLDHHLMRDHHGPAWLDALSAAAGNQVYCAADFMHRKRLFFEAERTEMYKKMSVPEGWHEAYAKGGINAGKVCRDLES